MALTRIIHDERGLHLSDLGSTTGLEPGSVAILNQNPFLEMACNQAIKCTNRFMPDLIRHPDASIK